MQISKEEIEYAADALRDWFATGKYWADPDQHKEHNCLLIAQVVVDAIRAYQDSDDDRKKIDEEASSVQLRWEVGDIVTWNGEAGVVRWVDYECQLMGIWTEASYLEAVVSFDEMLQRRRNR
jgi:hypothetical protein